MYAYVTQSTRDPSAGESLVSAIPPTQPLWDAAQVEVGATYPQSELANTLSYEGVRFSEVLVE
jgi:hypothetical protein